MAELTRAAGPFKYVGGSPALDFANALRGREDGAPRDDHLHSYADLVAWGRGAGLIDRSGGKRLLAEAERRPREAAAAFARAIQLREVIYRIFFAIAVGKRPSRNDVGALNAALAGALSRLRLTDSELGFEWGWDDEPGLDRILWPVLRAAADLLTSDRLARIRECGGEHCGWLFLDETKNRSRRWCEMSVCGNRAKARRHYDRTRRVETKASAR